MGAPRIETVSMCATVRMGEDFLLDDLVRLAARLVDSGWAVVEISSRRSGYVFELASPGGVGARIRYTWGREGYNTRYYIEVCAEGPRFETILEAVARILEAIGVKINKS